MTAGETKLWQELKLLRTQFGIHVRKQAPIGPYVADFAIQSVKLVIEVDGQFHFEGDGPVRDSVRDEWFKKAGYRVVRITTGDLEHSCDGFFEGRLGELGLMH